MDSQLTQKILKLRHILSQVNDAVVGFSGGVDSTFLLKMAKDEVRGRVIAVTIDSELLPREDIHLCETSAREIGVEHVVIVLDLLSHENIRQNSTLRCYYCKKEIFTAVKNYASSQGIYTVLEGMNTDDQTDYRPGARALTELGIESPLNNASLTKADIREAAREMGIANYNRPATPCLATRIPTGTVIEKTDLDMIEQAETAIRHMGFPGVRVRLHGDLARIELPDDSIKRIIDHEIRKKVVNILRKSGFRYICVDMEGYRMGSMNFTEAMED